MTAVPPPDQPDVEGSPSRRRVLTIGAVAAGAVVSIRPALAQTAGSVLACEIPVPDPGHAGSAVAADGTLVPIGTKGSFPAPGRAFKGEEVKRALAGGQLPGTTWESNRAYVAYIRRLQRGQGGSPVSPRCKCRAADMLYRAAPTEALLVAPLDAFTAVFHRASGITHLLSEPAPEILDALADEPLALSALLARLGARYDIGDAQPDALQARLAELVEAGLVEAIAGEA